MTMIIIYQFLKCIIWEWWFMILFGNGDWVQDKWKWQNFEKSIQYMWEKAEGKFIALCYCIHKEI